jgi:hypothetical protein
MENDVLGSVLGSLINNKNNDGWGNNGSGMFVIILFLLMLGGGGFGWGNRGPMGPTGFATKDDVYAATAYEQQAGATANLTQDVNALGYRNLEQFGAINNNISQQAADTRLGMCQSTNAITNGLAQVGYAVSMGQQQISREIEQNRYDNAVQTCNITTNSTANTQKILDAICDMKADMQQTRINEQAATIATLQSQISNQALASSIVNQVRPFPQPAYITASPYQSIYGGFTYGNFA